MQIRVQARNHNIWPMGIRSIFTNRLCFIKQKTKPKINMSCLFSAIAEFKEPKMQNAKIKSGFTSRVIYIISNFLQ